MNKILLLSIYCAAHTINTMQAAAYYPHYSNQEENFIGQRVLSNVFHIKNDQEGVLEKYIDQLSELEQRSLLKTPQMQHYTWIREKACSSYAQRLSNAQTLNFMLQNDAECRTMLNLHPSIQSIICTLLTARNRQDINHYIPMPQANIQNIVKSMPYSKEKASETIMQTPFDGNVVVLKKLFGPHPFERCHFIAPNTPSPIVPSSILSSQEGKETYFNEQEIVQGIVRDNQLLHPISAYSMSPSGQQIIALYKDRKNDIDTIIIFNHDTQGGFSTGSGLELQEQILNETSPCAQVHQDIRSTVSIHPHDPVITYVDRTHKIRTVNWLRGTQQAIQSPYIHTSVSYSPDGKYLVSICDSASVVIYDSQNLSPIKTLAYQNTPKSISWSPDGSKFVLIASNGAFVIETNTLEAHHVCRTLGKEYNGAAFNNDGKKLLTTLTDGSVTFWELGARGNTPFKLPENSIIVSSPIFIDDKHILINYLHNNVLSVDLWDVDRNTLTPFKSQKLLCYTQCTQLTKTYSLAQLIVLLSVARSVQGSNPIKLGKNHYLASIVNTFPPHIAQQLQKSLNLQS